MPLPRVYAVYNNNKHILGLMLSLWIVHLLLMSCVLSGTIGPGPEIQLAQAVTPPLHSIGEPYVEKLIWVTLLFRWVSEADIHLQDSSGTSYDSGIWYIFPALVFDITAGVFLTFGLHQRSRPYIATMPLVRLIIDDGLLYLAVVLLTNICWILVHVLEDDSVASLFIFCFLSATYRYGTGIHNP